jgi:hypothetical protein
MSQKLKLIFILSLFAACTLVAVPAIAQSKPGPPTQNVLVVNGAGQPVPTAAQGTTNVAGTVNIGNTPDVNIANTPTITVANTPSAPVPTRDVDYPARHSFQETCSGNADQSGTAICSIGAIPGNSEFVIQTLSAGVNGKAPFGGVQVTINNGTQLGGIQLPVIEQSSPNDWAATQAVTLYVGPNGVPQCTANTSPGGFLFCSFVGYLVSLP